MELAALQVLSPSATFIYCKNTTAGERRGMENSFRNILENFYASAYVPYRASFV
jgi:hypothetical protein